MKRSCLALIAIFAVGCTVNRTTTVSQNPQSLTTGSSGSTSGSGATSSSGGTGNIIPTGTGASVTLSWSPGATAPEGFVIEQSVNQTTFTTAAQVLGNVSTTTISGLSPGQTYYFRIHAFNATGNSAYAPLLTAVIPPSP